MLFQNYPLQSYPVTPQDLLDKALTPRTKPVNTSVVWLLLLCLYLFLPLSPAPLTVLEGTALLVLCTSYAVSNPQLLFQLFPPFGTVFHSSLYHTSIYPSRLAQEASTLIESRTHLPYCIDISLSIISSTKLWAVLGEKLGLSYHCIPHCPT